VGTLDEETPLVTCLKLCRLSQMTQSDCVRKRGTQKSEILTSSLFKNEFTENATFLESCQSPQKMLRAYRIRKILHLNHVLMIWKQNASFVENYLMRNGSTAIHVKTALMRHVCI